MIKHLQSLAAAMAIVVGFASAATAGAVLYDCTITQKKKGLDWISDKVGIIVKPGEPVMVLDAVVLHFLGAPLKVSSYKDNGKRIDVRWTVRGSTDSANVQIGHFDYTARITKSSGKFALYAKPDEFPNRFSGKGSCVTRKPE